MGYQGRPKIFLCKCRSQEIDWALVYTEMSCVLSSLLWKLQHDGSHFSSQATSNGPALQSTCVFCHISGCLSFSSCPLPQFPRQHPYFGTYTFQKSGNFLFICFVRLLVNISFSASPFLSRSVFFLLLIFSLSIMLFYYKPIQFHSYSLESNSFSR